MNDQAEKNRIGVNKFASSRFVTCFSHNNYESVDMWKKYGGDDKEKKVLLKLNNFSSNFTNVINTDYCYIDYDKKTKLFFRSDEYNKTMTHNCKIGQLRGLKQVNTEYQIATCIKSISMFDVVYLPDTHDVFKSDYSGRTKLTFGQNKEGIGVNSYWPSILGKHKSMPWRDERESRILCCLEDDSYSKYSYIDLQLKETFFNNMVVISSPWAKDSTNEDIQEIINNSTLSALVKNSISIENSSLHDTVVL